MALKEDFTKQLESQIAVWQEQIGDYQARLGQAGDDAKVRYEKALAGLKDNADQASKLLAQARGASEGAWKDMQSASGKALAQLQQGWADALKRFS